MPAPQTWTPERIEQLKALVAEGMTYEEIGRRLGVTKNQALSKSFRMELQHPNSPAPKPIKSADRLDRLNLFPSPGLCLWPNGDPHGSGFRFCGKSCRNPGEPYCAKHMAAAYVPPGQHRAHVAAIERAAKYGGKPAA